MSRYSSLACFDMTVCFPLLLSLFRLCPFLPKSIFLSGHIINVIFFFDLLVASSFFLSCCHFLYPSLDSFSSSQVEKGGEKLEETEMSITTPATLITTTTEREAAKLDKNEKHTQKRTVISSNSIQHKTASEIYLAFLRFRLTFSSV